MLNRKFGRWTVIERVDKPVGVKGRSAYWLCRCDCGIERPVKAWSLRSGKSQSCGCFNKEQTAIKHKIHGLSKHPLYTKLYGAIERCHNPNNPNYHNYGGRGITVCKEWRDNPKLFLDWASVNGYEKELTLDRRDNAGDYTPENCRFITKKENDRNRRTTKLSQEIVSQMRLAFSVGVFSYSDIGRLFGISRGYAHSIINEKVWA